MTTNTHSAFVMAPPRLPDGSELVMRVMPLPADTNSNGDIFGGWLMAQVVMAGAVLPSRIAKGRIATVAVNQFLFKQTVSVGDLLSFYARIERIDQGLQHQGHADVGQLGRHQAGQCDGHAPAPLPDVRQQLAHRRQPGVRQGRAGDRQGQGSSGGTAHDPSVVEECSPRRTEVSP